MEQSLIEQLITYLTFLIGVSSTGLAVLIDQLKPIVFDPVLNKYGDRVYLVTIYLTRTVAALLILLALGGASAVNAVAPVFGKFSEFGVLVISTLLIALGSDFIHVLLDTLTAIRDNKRSDSTPTVDITELLNSAKKATTPAAPAPVEAIG